jgi:SAM-dependent methyltransferase
VGTPNTGDRAYWNQRYAEERWTEEPSSWLTRNTDLLLQSGRALDIAGGTGRNALWLAARGWQVTVVDVSDVALKLAADRAEELDLRLITTLGDLSTDRLPDGPWDLVIVFHYLDRELLPRIASVLRPGGVLIGALATSTNLERNDRPPLPYLLDDGELPSLLGGLKMLEYEESWLDDRHDARFAARHSAPDETPTQAGHTAVTDGQESS